MGEVEKYQQLKKSVEIGKEKFVRAETAFQVASDGLKVKIAEMQERFGVFSVKELRELLEQKQAAVSEAVTELQDKIGKIEEV